MKALRFTDLIAANRVAGQRVFIRVDFNVPQDDAGRITDDDQRWLNNRPVGKLYAREAQP